ESAPAGGEAPGFAEAGPRGAGGAEPALAGDEASAAAGSMGTDGGDRQGPRKIMTPVDAALEILRGQAPGRGVHVRQIADAAARRRLGHCEPHGDLRVSGTAV